MNTKDLRALLALADELHFGKAALKLGIVQPVLSEIVRRLEAQAGVTIFIRRPRVTVTPEGAILLDAIRRALWQLEHGVAEAKQVASGSAGIVRVGLISAAMLTGLPQLLRRFAQNHPQVVLEIAEGHSAHLGDRMRRGELDIIITRAGFDVDALQSFLLVQDCIELVVPANHELAGERLVALSQLTDEDFVFFDRSAAPPYYDRIMHACLSAGLRPRVRQLVQSWGATLAIVQAGFGIAIGTRCLRNAQFPGVEFCGISDPMPDVSFYLSYHPDQISKLGRKLAAELRTHA